MTGMLNILFLGGAKRVCMAEKFKDAARARGMEAQLYSYEMETTLPIALEAEIVVGKKWNDPEVYADLLALCRKRGITVVVPFVDGAVAVAAEVARRSDGTVFAPTGNPELAEMMFNKRVANGKFIGCGLPVPRYFDFSVPHPMPLIAKPAYGSASKGLVFIDSAEQWDRFRASHKQEDYLIQERVDNRTEYTVDCYVSMLDGKVKAAVPRVRNAVIGGEVSRTTVGHYQDVIALAHKTLETLGLRGAVTVQMLRDNETSRLMLMEINPRLGGGATASVAAGADLPGMILDESLGRPATPCHAFRNLLVTRYLADTLFPL